MVVSCISTDTQTNQFYLCFACEECFPEAGLERHFASEQHLIHSLVSSLCPAFLLPHLEEKSKNKGSSRKLGFISLSVLFLPQFYLNPWRLPFAWEEMPNVTVMRSMALEEEKERGLDQTLKVNKKKSIRTIINSYGASWKTYEGQRPKGMCLFFKFSLCLYFIDFLRSLTSPAGS